MKGLEDKRTINLLLGMKIKKLRIDKGLSLQEMSDLCGSSVSYLSEIESGKKYPKADKMVTIASSLDISYNDLVSIDMDSTDFNPFHLSILNSFPFKQFDIQLSDVLYFLNYSDDKISAFLRTLYEVAQVYNMKSEFFLRMALRSMQIMNRNYFPDLEEKASAFRKKYNRVLSEKGVDGWKSILIYEYGYDVLEIDIDLKKDLGIFRTIYVNKDKPKLFINKKMNKYQRQFSIAKELGYAFLGYTKRATTAPEIETNSFDTLLTTFKASYFAGALLMNEKLFSKDIEKLFKKTEWDMDLFWKILDKYEITTEMFFHRASQMLGTVFGIEKYAFTRFHHNLEQDHFTMTKEFNFTEDYGVDYFRNENYCRRMAPISVLKAYKKNMDKPYMFDVKLETPLGTDRTYLSICYVQQSTTKKQRNVSFSIHILVDEKSREKIKLMNNKKLLGSTIQQTCERCPLSSEDCSDRVVPPSVRDEHSKNEKVKQHLESLLDTL